MKERHIIKTKHALRGLLLQITNLDLSKPWAVTVKPYKRNRSAEQQGLYWIWVKHIANQMNLSDIEVHAILKSDLLMIIKEREDEKFREQMDLYRKLYTTGRKSEAIALVDIAKYHLSTHWLNVTLFTEYLEQVELWAHDRDIFDLPQPPAK